MKVLTSPKGLVLDANAIVPPTGAMRQATNCVVDQPGVARSRPSNDLHLHKSATDYRPRAIKRFGGEIVAISTNATLWRLEDEGGVITGNAVPPTQAQIPRMESARSSLYHTSTTGIQKHTAGGTATIPAGVEPYTGQMARGVVGVSSNLGTTLAGGPLPGTPLEGRFYFDRTTVYAGDVFEWYKTVGATNYIVSIVIKRTDAAGYIRRSPPTRLIFEGTALPSPDAFLWQTYTVTAADITAGYFLVARVISSAPDEVDIFVPNTINDDLLGEALYTNPAQQGALGAKYAPPNAAELALGLGVVWYGNTISKHRATTTVANVAGSTVVTGVDEENPKGLLGAITTAPLANVSTTNLSTTVTGLSDDFERFLRVGMYITDATNITAAVAGTAFQADTLVVSWATGVAPGTVDLVVSKPATATGARDVFIGDVVSVGGRNFYGWAEDQTWSPDANFDGGRRVFGVPSTSVSASGRNAYVAASLTAAVNYEAIFDSTFRIRASVLGQPYVYSSTVTAPADLLFEEIGVGGAAFTVSSSNAEAFSPKLPITSDNDAEPGRLYYSEPDEPEAVPLPNFFRVGDVSEPILALTPLQSSLLIWKRDGLYRVSGLAPDAWRLDPVDAHTRLVTSGAVDVADGFAYAWTSDGVVRASERGVEKVSTQIDDYLGEFASGILTDQTRVGSWLCCWRSASLVLLGLQPSGPGGNALGATVVLALSLVTGAWTTFWQRTDEEILCADYDPDEALLYWSRDTAWEVRVFDRSCTGSDRRYDISSSSVAGLVMTVADSNVGTWIPNVGDWIKRGPFFSTYARIVDVALAMGTYTITMATAPGASGEGTTFIGIEGLPTTMEWQQTGPAAAWEIVREMQAHLDGVVVEDGPGTLYLAQGGVSSLGGPALSESSPPLPTKYSRPYRYGVPRAVARHAHFYPRVDINALGYAWRFHMLGLIGEPVSDRVRR